jgi:hypothetical protein
MERARFSATSPGITGADNQAAIKGLAMAKAILKDEAAKLAIGRKTFGNTLASSAK